MPKKNEPRLTLRQRLRADAEKKLDQILKDLDQAAARVLDQAGTDIATWDLLHIAGSKQNKSLRAHLVTKLANEAEAELERLYNNQQKLALGDNND
jgi:hypothetical protein